MPPHDLPVAGTVTERGLCSQAAAYALPCLSASGHCQVQPGSSMLHITDWLLEDCLPIAGLLELTTGAGAQTLGGHLQAQ